MKKIRIGLSTTEKLLSKIIKFIQGTKFSHSYVQFEAVEFETILIYESKGLNSNIINKKHFDGIIVEEYELELSDEMHAEMVKFILEEVGTSYAWKQLFGFLVVKLARVFGLKIRNPWPQPGKICSESCGEILVRFFRVTPDVGYDDMDLAKR